MNTPCVFCNIRDAQIPAPIIFHNDHIFVIKDIAPQAPVHYLIISKKHIHNVNALDDQDRELTHQLFTTAKMLGTQLAGDQSYRLVLNTGAGAGQTVFHLHMHFLAGGSLPGMMSSEL